MKIPPATPAQTARPDPRIVAKVRRDSTRYASFEPLPYEQDHDYLPQPELTFRPLGAREGGRPQR